MGHRIDLMFLFCVIYLQRIPFDYPSEKVLQNGIVGYKLQDIKLHDLGLPGFQHPDTHMEKGGLHPAPYSIGYTW